MNTHLTKASIYTDFNGLSELRAGARKQSPEARKEVARQFEAMFIQIMLKSMRDAGNLGESGDSEQVRFYQQMFDQQIALDLANSRGIGLARVFERQLGGEQPVVSTKDLSSSSRKPFDVPQAIADRAAEPVVKDPVSEPVWPPENPEQFVQVLWPAAQQAARKLGADPRVLVAQAALESGWGRKMPGGVTVNDSMNLFGIKADPGWKGKKVTVSTVEYRQHVAVRERAGFRAYDSAEESVDDYVAFLQNNPRYETALKHAAEPSRFLRELQQAGYATDPRYAEKIEAIMNSDTFVRAVGRLQQS